VDYFPPSDDNVVTAAVAAPVHSCADYSKNNQIISVVVIYYNHFNLFLINVYSMDHDIIYWISPCSDRRGSDGR